jgi:ABC-type nitrate/sulfonate/bicarbonate transport system permease component
VAAPEVGVSVSDRSPRRRRRRFLRAANGERLLTLLSPVLLLLAWEALVRLGWLDARFFPAPSRIVAAGVGLVRNGELARDVAISLQRIFLGFLLGAVPGVVLGIAMGLSRWVRAFLNPVVAATYPIPKSAVMPLVLLVFGLGEASKVVTVATGVFFLVLINTMTGVLGIERIYHDVGRNFGARGWAFFRTVALPGALPTILAGVKLGMGMGLILIAIAEMVGAKSGIGYMIWNAWQTFSVETMYVGLVVVSLLGFLLSLATDWLERLVIPWRR